MKNFLIFCFFLFSFSCSHGKKKDDMIKEKENFNDVLKKSVKGVEEVEAKKEEVVEMKKEEKEKEEVVEVKKEEVVEMKKEEKEKKEEVEVKKVVKVSCEDEFICHEGLSSDKNFKEDACDFMNRAISNKECDVTDFYTICDSKKNGYPRREVKRIGVKEFQSIDKIKYFCLLGGGTFSSR